MSENSAIEWTDHTFNPWEGCQKVGPGCDACYAETRNARYNGGTAQNWGPGAPRRKTSAANWRQPIKWNAKAKKLGVTYRVFCASLADVFDNAVPAEWRQELAALIKATPHLIWMLLTKRIGNAADMLAEMFPEGVPSNVWIGATIVNQAEADRDGPKLKAAKLRHRITRAFVSFEPLLGMIDDLSMFVDWLDWAIVGGESGNKARPLHPDWARIIRDWCIRFGVAFFFKQWGEWAVAVDRQRDDPDWRKDYSREFRDGGNTAWLNLAGGCGFHGECFHVMRRVGKKAAGNELDGQVHQNWPEAA